VGESRSDSSNSAEAWLPDRAKSSSTKATDEQANGGSPAAHQPVAEPEQADAGAREWLPSELTDPARKAEEPGKATNGRPEVSEPARKEVPAEEKPTAGALAELAERDEEAKPAKVQTEGREPSKRIEELEALLERSETDRAELRAALERRQQEFEQALERLAGELDETLEGREAEYSQALRERDEALKEREAELEEQLNQIHEKREAGLNRQFERRSVELEKQLAVLEDRLDAREAELRDRAIQREAKLMNRIEDLQAELADAKLGMSEAPSAKRSRRGGPWKNGELDLNEASFEDLRELGLSVTQSARVIAYRDTRGGFDSLEELDEIPGLPRDARQALMSRLRL
jgi:DNA uptake protein ComE-like DNA-binding protein